MNLDDSDRLEDVKVLVPKGTNGVALLVQKDASFSFEMSVKLTRYLTAFETNKKAVEMIDDSPQGCEDNNEERIEMISVESSLNSYHTRE